MPSIRAERRAGRSLASTPTTDPQREISPRKELGWGHHSYDWMGQTAWSALDQREYLAAQAAANSLQWIAALSALQACAQDCVAPASQSERTSIPISITSGQYLRDAVIAAINQTCRCQSDRRNIVAQNWNFSLVVNPNRLPSIFGQSVSIHSLDSRSANIGYGYELKYYTNNRTITTSTWSFEHIVGIPSWLMGDPVNTLNARGYCYYSKAC